jgi:hypothetical protein
MAKARSFKVGRSAKTGEFRTVKSARKFKSTSVVETMKVPAKRKKRKS